MLSRLTRSVILITAMTFLSGCWSQINFDQLTVVSAVGLDITEQRQLEVTVQLVNPTLPISAGGGNQQRRSFATYSAAGETIEDALEIIRQQAKKSLFFPQTRVVLIGEKLARSGLDGMMDYFWRNQFQNFNSFILIFKGEAKEALTDAKELQAVSADEWKAFLHNKYYKNFSGAVELYQFLPRLEQIGFQAAAPALYRAQGYNSAEQIMEIDGLGVFSGGKLAGWLDREEAQIVNWLNGISRFGTARITHEGNRVNFRLEPLQTSIRPIFSGDKLTLHIRLMGQAGVITSTRQLDLSEGSMNNELRSSLQEQLKQQIEQTVSKLFRVYRSDAIGFGEVIHRKAPARWKSLKKEWNEQLPQIELAIEVSFDLVKSGLLIEGILTKDDDEI